MTRSKSKLKNQRGRQLCKRHQHAENQGKPLHPVWTDASLWSGEVTQHAAKATTLTNKYGSSDRQVLPNLAFYTGVCILGAHEATG